jgi:hypothetical protein
MSEMNTVRNRIGEGVSRSTMSHLQRNDLTPTPSRLNVTMG